MKGRVWVSEYERKKEERERANGMCDWVMTTQRSGKGERDRATAIHSIYSKYQQEESEEVRILTWKCKKGRRKRRNGEQEWKFVAAGCCTFTACLPGIPPGNSLALTRGETPSQQLHGPIKTTQHSQLERRLFQTQHMRGRGRDKQLISFSRFYALLLAS